MRESHLRSLIKAVSWRILGTLVTMFISYIITQRLSFAIYIGIFEFLAKVGFFYAHERLWNSVSFGMIKTS